MALVVVAGKALCCVKYPSLAGAARCREALWGATPVYLAGYLVEAARLVAATADLAGKTGGWLPTD